MCDNGTGQDEQGTRYGHGCGQGQVQVQDYPTRHTRYGHGCGQGQVQVQDYPARHTRYGHGCGQGQVQHYPPSHPLTMYDDGTGQHERHTRYGHGGYGHGYGQGYGHGYGHGYGNGQGQGQGQGQGMLHSSSFKTSSSESSHQMTTVFGSDPFCEIKPSAFPPGTDPKVVECFKRIDVDRNGVVDDRELQAVLSSHSQSFNLRTVHLLMYEFTHSNKRIIGPRELVPLLKCLQTWRTMFQRFDRDRNGSIDSMELGQALNSLGYCVSPVIVNLLIAKFNKSGGYGRCSLQYDQFIECCLTVKGLTETFKAKADQCGKTSFGYEEFLLNILPFIIA